MLDKLQRDLSKLGYVLTIHRVLPEQLEALTLPESLDLRLISGLLCLELFDPSYGLMLCDTGVPLLFIDSPYMFETRPLGADLLLMDNETWILEFVRRLAALGVKSLGFIGKITHCRSFYERYRAFRWALDICGLKYKEELCALGTPGGLNDDDFVEHLRETLLGMKSLPQAFICANDFVAIDALEPLKERGIRIPEDLMLFGFDDSPEARIVTPALSTVKIHSEIIAYEAVNLLISRIREPELNYRTVYTETSLCLRESTRPVNEPSI